MALDKFKAPPLPLPPKEYSAEYVTQLIRTLGMIFAQWDSNTPNHAETYTADYFNAGALNTTTIELGHATDTTLARVSAGNVSIEGNVIYRAGGTDVPLTDGGTGASNASDARTNLGLAIGVNVQAYDADLTTWAGITPGTGVGTALATNVGSAGAFVTFGGALGTPSSGTLTNCTGLPAAGLVASTTQAVGFGSIELGHATDTTISRPSAGNLAVEGNLIYRAGGTDVPLTDGGTGASDASGARTNLGLGTAAIQNTGTSGTNVPLLDGANTWSAAQTFSANPVVSGGGVVFPATQVASADANTLDDYEEGTFTPQLVFGGGSTGMTFSTQAGRYTKIGRLVFIEIRLVLTAKGSSTGAAQITGLPFTTNAAAPTAQLSVAMVSMAAMTCPANNLPVGSTTITLQDFTGSTSATLTEANFTDTSIVKLSGYFTV
jgi:hypothetical protein